MNKLLIAFLFALTPILTYAQHVQKTPPAPVQGGYVGKPEDVDPFWQCIKSAPVPESEKYTFCNRLERMRSNPPSGYDGGSGYYPGSYSFAGYGSGYGFDPIFLDPCQGYLPERSQNVNCTVAEVKFDLQDRNLGDNVIIRIDGQFMGLAKKYSHKLTSGLRLRAEDEYRLTLEWTSKDGIKTIEDRLSPLSMRHQDGAYWYPVSKQRFTTPAYGRTVIPNVERVDGKAYITGSKP